MVLGISLNRKPKKKEGPVIRTSPSLPSLHAQGIPWPENLVDIEDVNAARSETPQPVPKGSGRQTTASVPFHKPFRSPTPGDNQGPSIASIYTGRTSSTFVRGGTYPNINSSRSQRRRVAPTLNVRKSSFLILYDHLTLFLLDYGGRRMRNGQNVLAQTFLEHFGSVINCNPRAETLC